MDLLLVRHGEIDSNHLRVYSGRSDEPLNSRGIGQAIRAAQQLRHLNVTGLYSSPILRARQTAQQISFVVGIEPVFLEAFTELGMGPWEGLSEVQVAKAFPTEWSVWNHSPADLALPGRERLEEVLSRIRTGLQLVYAQSAESGVNVLVSHVAVIRVLSLFASGQDLNQYKQIQVPNAEPLRIHLENHSFLETH